MELQAILVLCGAGVAVAALVLLAGLFSTTGTTYEDAIAQQRKATTELMELASNKNKPKKANKKANKKLAKKEKKDNPNVPSTSDPDSEVPAESGMEDEGSKHHVDFSPPVVVDVPRDSPPHVKIRKRGKDPKVKPILVNKDDPSCVSDPSTPPSPVHNITNHFEEIHPKDECELLHAAQTAEKNEKKEESTEKREVRKSGKGGRSKPAPAPKVEEPKEEVVVQEQRPPNTEPPKEQRKAKKNEKKVQQEEASVTAHEEVILPLNIPQPSELTTEKLLKQTVAPATIQASPPPVNKNKKNKKTEPNVHALLAGEAGELNIGELVRLVSAASLSRTEIQILTDTLLNKHHDTLPQHSDWSEGPNDPVQKMKKQLAEKEKALTEELELSQTLQAKIKELRTSLNAERARATAATRALEDNASTQRAELHTLQTRLQRLLEDNQALQKEKVQFAEAQTQRAQMEVHIQRLQESEATLIQQCGALQAEVGALQGQLGASQTELNQRMHEARQAIREINDLMQSLHESNRAIGDLKSQCQKALKSEQDAQKEMKQLQEKLNRIPELEAEVQLLKNQTQQKEDEAEKQKQQLHSELSQAQEELTELRQLKAAPAQNGLPPHTCRDPAEMAKIESAIEALRSELLAAEKSSTEQKQQVVKLTEELQQYQDKNNKLRTRNWKIMEALQSAEKALQTKSTTAAPTNDALLAGASRIEEAKYNEMASVLKSVCPSAAPSIVPSHEWLTAFAQNLKHELHKAKSTEVAPPIDRIDEMKAHNEQLQAAVDKYKRVIDDTEGALSRLQLNVSEEEGRWAQRLSELQKQLDEISQRDNQSQKKIMSLEAELRQAMQNTQKHNFTDSERLTEENSRLMAGLSDKHKVDNGPLQMNLEDI